MGEFVNPKWLNWVCWCIAIILVVMNFYLLVPPVAPWWAYFLIAVIGVAYVALMGWVFYFPFDNDVSRKDYSAPYKELEEGLPKP